jgi:preprotein translocase SecF subunit
MIFGIGVAYITTVVYAKILYSSETFIDVFDKCSPCGHSLLPMDVNLFSNGGRVAMAVIYLSCLLFSVGRFVESRPVLGVDLQGGSEISVMLDREVDAAVIGAVAHTFFGQRAEVYGLDKRQDAKAGGFLYVVRVPHSASASAEIQSDEQRKHYTGIETEVKTPENFVRTLASVPGCESASLSSVQSVGAIQLADNKRKVVGLSFLGAALLFGILWYLFGGMAALASMVALVTDTLICLGALSVFHIPLTIQMVACLLTMVGYSVNDSILLCGHMKDYFKQYGADGAKSMSLVLQPYSSRVVLTSLSTLFASGSLWLLGFTAIRDFGIVLSVGVFFGMLSSVTIVVYLSESSLRRNFGKR